MQMRLRQMRKRSESLGKAAFGKECVVASLREIVAARPSVRPHLQANPSVRLNAGPSVRPSVSPLFPFIYQSVRPSVHLIACPAARLTPLAVRPFVRRNCFYYTYYIIAVIICGHHERIGGRPTLYFFGFLSNFEYTHVESLSHVSLGFTLQV